MNCSLKAFEERFNKQYEIEIHNKKLVKKKKKKIVEILNLLDIVLK